MNIKIDVIISNLKLAVDVKNEIKYQRGQLYASLPVQRVWLYIKILRNLSNFDLDDFKKQIRPLELDGVEDNFAKGMRIFSEVIQTGTIRC
jgi:hypothetical protein